MLIKRKFLFPSYMRYINKNIFNNNLTKYLILGNITCDLDSFLSTYLLSLAKTFSLKPTNNLYIPILNCERGELKYRFDIDYLTKIYKLNQNNMLYINDPSIKTLLKKNKNKIILVDHNKVDVEQAKLLKSKNNEIVSIYDHHKDDKHNKSNNIIKHIIYPLGSCSTLILNKFYLSNPLLFNFINPILSISGILIATENFNKKLYNKKWVELDKFVFNEILYENEKLFPLSFINNRKKYINDYYHKIRKEKYNKKKNLNIGVRGILKKDLKNFEWENGVKAKWSTLQIDYDDIVSKFGERKIIMEMDKICKDSKYNLYIINYKGKNGDKIIYKIYNYSIEHNKYLDFIKRLKASLNNRYFDVIQNNEKLVTFEVETSLSRKHFEPYIRSIFYNKK